MARPLPPPPPRYNALEMPEVPPKPDPGITPPALKGQWPGGWNPLRWLKDFVLENVDKAVNYVYPLRQGWGSSCTGGRIDKGISMFDRERAWINQRIALYLGWSLKTGALPNLYADVINPFGERTGSVKLGSDGLGECLVNGAMWPDFVGAFEIPRGQVAGARRERVVWYNRSV